MQTVGGEIGQMVGVCGRTEGVAIPERCTDTPEGARVQGGRIRAGERNVRAIAHTVEGVVGVRGATGAVARVGAVIDVVVIAVLRTD